MKRALRVGLSLLLVGAAAASGMWLWRSRQVQAKASLATATARKGDFEVIVRARGEVVSTRSAELIAPQNVPNLQIQWLAPNNSPVKKDEVVVRFDPSSARQQLQERQAALEQAEATLAQGVAQQRITAEQDQMDLTASRVEVERQKLEVSKKEIVSRLQGESSAIDLSIAQEKQRVREAVLDLHQKAATSQIASLTRQRDKAIQDVEVTEGRLKLMELRAPSDGVVIYATNNSQGWQNAKPFKVGDGIWSGSVIAEIPDFSTLALKGKLEEMDRGRVAIGQLARIRVDPLPEKPFQGKLDAISPLVEQSFDWPPSRNFRAYARFSEIDPRLRPQMNGHVDIVVQRIPDAISVPASAVFTRRDRPTVYVEEKEGWRPQEVEIIARNPDEVAVKGIAAGTRIALVDPEVSGAKKP